MILKYNLEILELASTSSCSPPLGRYAPSRVWPPLLKNSGFAPEPIVSAKIFSSVIRPTLLYGCPSIYMSETNIENLNRCQAKLIKSCLGLKPQTHSTLLLEALNVLPIKRTLFVYFLDLMRSCLLGNSQSNTFYNYLIKNGMKI